MTAAIAPKASGAAQRSEGSAEAAVRVFRPELTFADSTIYLGETADYAQNLVSTAWKHGDEAANEAAMGAPPQLTLAYEPGAGAFRQDTDVSAAVSIGGRDATAYTTMVNTGDGAADHQFTVFVKACSLTITKAGAAQQSDSFLFDVTDEAGAVRTVAVHGNGSVTIGGLPVGTYTVCERESWSWRYEGGRTARAALTVLARRARYVQLDMEDPAALAAELLYRWGIAAGDGGRRAALTVVCGDVREDTEGPAIYLTEDCGARQTPVWTSPRAAALAVPVTEPLAAVLTAAGKWQISDIHITDLLDIRTESHYNAT